MAEKNERNCNNRTGSTCTLARVDQIIVSTASFLVYLYFSHEEMLSKVSRCKNASVLLVGLYAAVMGLVLTFPLIRLARIHLQMTSQKIDKTLHPCTKVNIMHRWASGTIYFFASKNWFVWMCLILAGSLIGIYDGMFCPILRLSTLKNQINQNWVLIICFLSNIGLRLGPWVIWI